MSIRHVLQLLHELNGLQSALRFLSQRDPALVERIVGMTLRKLHAMLDDLDVVMTIAKDEEDDVREEE